MTWIELAPTVSAAFLASLVACVEAATIVLAAGSPALIGPAALGALAAAVLVTIAAVAIHKPLARVPENTLKFAVGVLISAFGIFWTGEGVGIEWPGHDLALIGIAAVLLGASLLCVRLADLPAQPMEAR